MSALPPFRAAALVAAAVVLCLAPGCSSATDAAPTEVTGRIVDLQGEGSEIEAFPLDGDERVELWIADE